MAGQESEVDDSLSLSPPQKRRRKTTATVIDDDVIDVNANTGIEVPAEGNQNDDDRGTGPSNWETEKVNELLLDVMFDIRDPFRANDRAFGQEGSITRLIRYFFPSYVNEQVAKWPEVKTREIVKYYKNTLEFVTGEMKVRFGSDHTVYGCVALDGFSLCETDDVTNILMKFQSFSSKTRSAYLLGSICKHLEHFSIRNILDIADCGRGFDKIAGVVTDSSESCLEAQERVLILCPGIFTANDQVHAIHLLISDIAQLSFVEGVLNTVRKVFRKTMAVKRPWKRIRQKCLSGSEAETLETNISTPQEDEYGMPVLPSKPIMMTHRIPPTFARSENVLLQFLRNRATLREIVVEPHFRGYMFNDDPIHATDQKEWREYVALIDDHQLHSNVLAVYHILKLLCDYARHFNHSSAQLSEPFAMIQDIRRKIMALSTTTFLTIERKGWLFRVIDARVNGDVLMPSIEGVSQKSPKFRILSDVHYCATMLDPNLSHETDGDERCGDAFVRQALSFLRRVKGAGGYSERHVQMLLSQVEKAKAVWSDMHNSQDAIRYCLNDYSGNPFGWWKYRAGDLEINLLREMAMMVLSLVPSSFEDERGSIMSSRFNPSFRDTLPSRLFDAILFTSWNGWLIRKNGTDVSQLMPPSTSRQGCNDSQFDWLAGA